MAEVQNQVAAENGGVTAADGSAVEMPMVALYVGDLDNYVHEAQLYDKFRPIGEIDSVKVCKEHHSTRSLGYGYVNYKNAEDAARAIEVLNFTTMNGSPIRVSYSRRDPSIRKSGTGNIFIKNLDKAIDNRTLRDTFSCLGTIISSKIALDSFGESKGYAFIQFDSVEAAQKAIDQFNGTMINQKRIYVGRYVPKHERETFSSGTEFSNVFVKNLSETTTEQDLKKIFGEFGSLTSIVVMRDEDGKSKCFGFINFESADAAAKAVDSLNGKKFDEKEWYVGKAQKKSERKLELKSQFGQTAKEAVDKLHGLNLYIKNLDDGVDDDKLKELFSEFGTITSCKVMRDPGGISKGSGFVAFTTPEEASRALSAMNGKLVISKPLYVALLERKEERRARLQAQFSQVRPDAMTTSTAPRVPVYPPGVQGFGQRLVYGQAPPAIIPPQTGFGYQQQLASGMRPGVAPMPNFYAPVVQQGLQGHRPGGRRGTGPAQQIQQTVPVAPPPQVIPRGRMFRYPSVPYNVGGMVARGAALPQPFSAAALATALANATADQQRTILGEQLFPLVNQLAPGSSTKITGMLLEMDHTEILHLLESPDALKAKVAEAMDVLRNARQPQDYIAAPDAQFAALSLNDNVAALAASC